MAISSVTNRVAYQGDGTSAVFAFGYELHGTNDLAVFAFNSSATTGGLIRPLTKDLAGPNGYSFSGSVNHAGIYPSGGEITLNSSPNVQTAIVIFRSSAVTADFLVNRFQPIPGDGVTNAIDRLTLIAQRAQDLNTRSVRLPDGFFGTFDTTLPENILQSAGKRLIVNSGATGFTFDETLASYIPNTIAYANTNSSITSLGGAATDLFLKSQGSSAPVWGAINIGSAAVNAGAITGLLPIPTGGTGQSSFVVTGLIFASSANEFGSIPSASEGSILTAHGSSAPSFDTFSATNINSGLVRVENGGTGTGEVFDRGHIVIVGSAGVYGQTHVLSFNSSASRLVIGSTLAIAEVKLVGFGAAPVRTSATGIMLNGSTLLTSEVSGVLPVTSGGTGVTGLVPQYGVVYVSSATEVAVVPSAAPGTVLTANGSSAPSFQAFSQTPLIFATKTANYNATTADDVLLLDSSSYTVNLYGVVGNSGRRIKLRRISPTNANSITIAGSSATINGSSSITLDLFKETVSLITDGTEWFVEEKYLPTIAAAYQMTAGQNGLAVYNFNSSIYDTQNIVTTGLTWKATAPKTGKYALVVNQQGNTTVGFSALKNSSITISKLSDAVANTQTVHTAQISLSKNDYIQFLAGASNTITVSGNQTHFEIFFIGE